jgi:hypothetical protein
MKELEALERLFSNLSGEDYTDENLEHIIDGGKIDYNIVREALKRNEPMKWIEVQDETGSYDKCPVCGYPSYNELGHNHYCTVCGQRLEVDEE